MYTEEKIYQSLLKEIVSMGYNIKIPSIKTIEKHIPEDPIEIGGFSKGLSEYTGFTIYVSLSNDGRGSYDPSFKLFELIMDRNYKSQSKKEVAKKILHILRHEFIHHTQQIKKGLNGEEDNYKYITDDENDEKSFIFYFLQDDEIGANAYAYANGGFKDINKAISQKHEPFFDLIKNVYKNANKNEKIGINKQGKKFKRQFYQQVANLEK